MPIVITVPRTPYYKVILRDKPIGYWRLGETSGSTAFDSSGNGLHLADTSGTPTRGVPGLITGSDTAYDFTSNGWLEHSDDPLFDITGALTIEFWFKKSTTPSVQEAFVGKYSNSPNRSYAAIMQGDGFLNFRICDDGSSSCPGVNGDVDYSDGNVHYYTGVFLPNTYLRLFVDGNLHAEETQGVPGSIDNTPQDFRIGEWFDIELDATIDEVAIYNKVLTPTQIQKHYNAGI